MNKDDVTRWAREAGINLKDAPEKASGVGSAIVSYYDLKRFAQAAYAAGAAAEQEKFAADLIEYGKAMAAAEREACAKLCDEQQELVGAEMCCVAMNCAAAIRARGEIK